MLALVYLHTMADRGSAPRPANVASVSDITRLRQHTTPASNAPGATQPVAARA